MNRRKELVSIVMPAYNASRFISESIDSIEVQTYTNWELLITDDCSSDNTAKIIKERAEKDSRIKYFKLEYNSGAAVARNNSIEKSIGRYIAFLDSDDLWRPEKLEHQIQFMEKNDSSFCCTIYEKIDEAGKPSGVIIDNSNIVIYDDLLRNCPGNSTVIYDVEAIGKHYAIDLKKRNDYVLWLSVIKDSKRLDCLKENLSYYRERSGSISSNKMKLIKYHWHIYGKIEKINLFKSAYLVAFWCFKGVKRKLKKH